MSLVALLPVHANYPCILRPPASEPTTPNGDPHNLSSTNQCLATKTFQPPNVGKTDATGSARQSPVTTVVSPKPCKLPPNTMMVPMQYFTIALWFSIYVGETNVSYMCGQ